MVLHCDSHIPRSLLGMLIPRAKLALSTFGGDGACGGIRSRRAGARRLQRGSKIAAARALPQSAKYPEARACLIVLAVRVMEVTNYLFFITGRV